jgi:hypothetical protein
MYTRSPVKLPSYAPDRGVGRDLRARLKGGRATMRRYGKTVRKQPPLQIVTKVMNEIFGPRDGFPIQFLGGDNESYHGDV